MTSTTSKLIIQKVVGILKSALNVCHLDADRRRWVVLYLGNRAPPLATKLRFLNIKA